ncbi:hypothetical protein CLOM_g11263 [Closterium sp. NIES-68]|nr:hypothetical protein CLOM_g6945 [Closterium sp. NIES-68]GJP52168.1 hypothetical protein CLOM_g11263 [Closterium sp. NIES-68]
MHAAYPSHYPAASQPGAGPHYPASSPLTALTALLLPRLTWRLKRRCLDKDKKDVRDTNGNLHFKVADRLLSIPRKTTIQDAKGAPVCTLAGKMLSLHNTTFLCPGDSGATENHLFKAKKSIFTFCPILKVFLRGNYTKNPDIILSGSFFQT